MKHFYIFLVVIFCCTQIAQSQSISKTGVLQIRLRSSGSILQNQQVKGYYTFYTLEKKDRKNNNYMLSVMDENLRELNSITVVRPATYVLIEGAFNESAFGFLFYDTKTRDFELVSYDQTLKQTGSIVKEVKNRSIQIAYSMVAQGNDPTQAYLTAVPGQGFMFYGLSDDETKYQLEFYNNTMKKVWTSNAPVDGYKYEIAMEAFQNDQFIGSLIYEKKNLLTRDIDIELLVLNIADGKQVFRAPIATSKYTLMLSDAFFDKEKQNFVLFGEYFELGDKEANTQSLGLMALTLDMKGKIVKEKINSWATDISKVTPINEKGKIEGLKANILFHDIVRTNDGSIFAIGEQYKKVASGRGIAMNALSGGSGMANTQLNIYNMIILEFDKDYTIKKLHLFEKDKNIFLLPAGATASSGKILSYYAKSLGGFDYAYTQLSKDAQTFIVSYINYDKEKGEKGKNVLGSIVYTPEKKFTVDKLPLTRKSSEYNVFRAKEGYVMVMEYFKKEKRLDTRLEKINY